METFAFFAIAFVLGFIAFKVVQSKRKVRNTPPVGTKRPRFDEPAPPGDRERP